jgi:glutamate-ammonia-ligase adenylyltransferase
MTPFKDAQAAERTFERLEALAGQPVPGFIRDAFEGNPDPDLALTNLERWLRATGSPGLYMEQISGLPSLGRLLITILGASQPLADSLIQNPELSSLVLEPGQLRPTPTRERVGADGERLLSAATSYSHALDRLRFLRQRWNLPIVINDLSGAWDQETVWRALSDVADALIELALQAAWKDQRKQRELPEDCPVLVVAFGKLGGHELNYSSDIDLVYASEDGLPEKLERDCGKFCEALGRALSDRMGRGSLYRVDLRLRPYGGAGPIVRSMRSVEAYYNLYAEPWEVQALLRSRAIAGPPDLIRRWEEMRVRTCFRPKLSDIALEHMLAMRARIEEGASEHDLKRGVGGIRDVEFLTQVHQLLYGHDRPELQARPTCDALRALDAAGFVEHPVATALIDGYTFLRKLEHRTQLVGDQQTHSLPIGAEAREALARSMGEGSWSALATTLDTHRRTIQTLYRSSLHLEPAADGDRDRVAAALGPHAPAALQWFDLLPERDAFYMGLAENRDSLDRVQKVLADAPRLVPAFKASVALTEQLLSGEIEEPTDEGARIARLAIDAPIKSLADAYTSATTVVLTRWILSPTFDLGARLSAAMDALLAHCLQRLYADFHVVATGSYGTRDFGPGSDADLILLTASKERHLEAEQQAQHLLTLLGQLKRLGAPVEVDLRLRPEGGKGLLVRTYDGFRAYDFEGMEMWERFALGHARLVRGSEEALKVVLHSAYGLPLTPERLRELARMKRRVETERVKPQHVHRDVKLGSGGLNDIEWLVHLHEMRFPGATKAGEATEMPDRIRQLVRVGLVNAVESELLLEAHRYLLELRTRIYLQGLPDNLLPENPDKLHRLAVSCGLPGANELLARHREVTEAVRRMYLDGLERLRA